MNKPITKLVFGRKGTGFLGIEWYKAHDYHGKVRVLVLGDRTYYRPQSFYYDWIHVIGTHKLTIFRRPITTI